MICMSCGNPILGTVMEDGFMCAQCGRTGLCEHCSAVGNHDCEPLTFWIWDEGDEDDDGEYDPPDDWLDEPETEIGEGEGLLLD